MIRCPEWTTSDFSIKVNGKEYAENAQTSTYVAIDRKWKNGDIVEISLPMQTTLEWLDNTDDYVAIKRGPIVLSARTGNQNLTGLVADDGRWSHIAHGPLVPVAETPILIGSPSELQSKVSALQPVPKTPALFCQRSV